MIEETGVGIKNPLWFIGVVENRNDPRKEGRVQVRAFSVHGTNAQVPTDSLPWAICISGSYDPNYPIPPLNAWVFGFFIDGRDAQQPMILGLIPTQMTGLVDPVANGWGAIPGKNVNLDSQGSRATDFGQPQNSRKARGEDTQNTGVLMQEVNRLIADFSSAVDGLVIKEPPPAYNTEYPYNRVIETAGGHTVELDDSPGGERITIYHSEGAFIEIDNNGMMNIKAVGDLYLGSMKNVVIIAEGRQLVKIKGDAIVSVDGNMLHEVNGDMRQVVRGNYELSVAGQLNLNASEEIQARAAKVRIEANVEGINIKAGKKINMQSGQTFSIKSGTGILQEAVGDINIKSDNHYIQTAGAMHTKSGDAIFQEAAADINIKGVNLFVESAGTFNLKSASNINAESAESINIKSGVGIFQEAAGDINIKGANLFTESSGTFNLKSSAAFLDAPGNIHIKASHVRIGGGTKVSINASVVAIDDIIQLASSNSATPAPASSAIAADAAEPATEAEPALPTFPAEAADLPEPAAKSSGNGGGGDYVGGGYRNPSASGGGGYISTDDFVAGEAGSGAGGGSLSEPLSSSYTQGALRPLLDLIGQAEGAGYDTISNYIQPENYPPRPITTLTVDEVLAWQNKIDEFQQSEASGRYQIMETTLLGLKGNGIVTGSELFNPKTQDDLCIALLKGRGLNRFLNGIITAEQFGNQLCREWASFPVITGIQGSSPRGYYAGQGGKLTEETVLSVLKAVKDYKPTTTPISSNAQ